MCLTNLFEIHEKKGEREREVIRGRKFFVESKKLDWTDGLKFDL